MTKLLLFYPVMVVVVVTFCDIEAKPVNFNDGEEDKSSSTTTTTNPVEYLFQFGYIPQISFRGASGLNPSPLLDENSAAVRNAVKDFQDFAGLKMTGELDEPTLKLMKSPRCGVRDKGGEVELKRAKRYVHHSSRWHKNKLTYFVASYPADSSMTEAEVDAAIGRAFSIWERESALSFTRVYSDTADIRLDFYYGRHGEDQPFDGRGGVLAHAFFPRWGGDVHFDASEDWINRYSRSRVRRGAKQLLQTAVHEIGHSLGLQHSKDRTSIMAPFYQGWMDEVSLKSDDIAGIKSMYGHTTTDDNDDDGIIIVKPQDKPMAVTKPPPIFKPVKPDDAKKDRNLCENPEFDAATQTADGSFYVFRGQQYWKLKTDQAGVEDGYPRPNTDWSGLPGSVDAAFYNPEDRFTYILKGGQVGKYLNKRIQSGYPKNLADEFKGLPRDTEKNPLDAALIWGKNGQLYLFRGNQYWKYNFDKRTVEDFYPRDVAKNWRGLPGGGIDSALRWKNGKSYFFRRGEYWRFNDETVAVDDKPRVRYPRTIGKWWLACHQNPLKEDPAGTAREPRRWVWSD